MRRLEKKFEVKISNILGQTVYKERNRIGMRMIIPIDDWTAGLYIVEIGNRKYGGVKKNWLRTSNSMGL